MTDERDLAEAFDAAYPELAEVAAVAPDPVYLVGGAVRDLLLGRGRGDIDLAVEGTRRRWRQRSTPRRWPRTRASGR